MKDISGENYNNTSEPINFLTQMLLTYTEQLEEYERANGPFSLTACTVLIGIIAAFSAINDSWVRLIGTIAVPCLEIIFTFAFAHYNRRIAYYRGYCINIEKKLIIN
jgi:hypothetical protein